MKPEEGTDLPKPRSVAPNRFSSETFIMKSHVCCPPTANLAIYSPLSYGGVRGNFELTPSKSHKIPLQNGGTLMAPQQSKVPITDETALILAPLSRG